MTSRSRAPGSAPWKPAPLPALGFGKLKEAIRAAVLRQPVRRPTWSWARPCAAASRCDWPPPRLTVPARPCAAGLGEELIATEVRVALSELGKVAGAVYSEDLLDRIFSRFCIGK